MPNAHNDAVSIKMLLLKFKTHTIIEQEMSTNINYSI